MNRTLPLAFILPCVALSVIQRSHADDNATVIDKPARAPRPVPRFDYHDDRDGRNLADVRLTVKNQSELPTLEILISAVGPNVDPIPGYRGVKGANRYTAEELALMLSGQHDVLVTTSRSALSGLTRGGIQEGRRGRIPQRRLLSSGRIDFAAQTPIEYPLEVKLNTGPISKGTQQTEVLIDGIPRMRISFHFGGRRAQITGFEEEFEAAGREFGTGAAQSGRRAGPRRRAGHAGRFR